MRRCNLQPSPAGRQVDGLNVVITVQRLWSRYVVSAIFPIVATAWLVRGAGGSRHNTERYLSRRMEAGARV